MSEGPAENGIAGRDIMGKKFFRDRVYKVVNYDFRRPDKFSKEQIRTFEIMHETFARLAEVRLSSMLRTKCEASVAIVDQLNFGEFTGSLPDGALLATLSLLPFQGLALLHVEETLAGFARERLFGAAMGDALSAGDSATKGFTEVERAAFEGSLAALLPDVVAAWEQVEKLKPHIAAIETDPRACQIVPPTEMVILVGIEVRIGKLRGTLNLVYPFLTIEPIINKLLAKYWYDPIDGGNPPKPIDSSPAYDIKTKAEVLFQGASLSIGELKGLRKGSLVPLPGLDSATARLRAGGQEVARLRLVDSKANGTYALEPIIEKGARLEKPGAFENKKAAEGLLLGISALEGRLGEFGAELKIGFRDFGERLSGIEGKQGIMDDRLAFGAADEVISGSDRARKAFSSLSAVPAETCGIYLGGERPQIVALVLSSLEDALAAGILDALPEAIRAETARRVAIMENPHPEALAAAERVLTRKLATNAGDNSVPGGLRKIVGILNLSRRTTEKQVVEALEARDPALAEEIKKNMFVFEDISLLDKETINLLLGRSDEDDIILALKPLDASTRRKALFHFDEAAASRILAKVEAMGRVRLSECDAAGQRIVETVRKIDEEGLMGLVLPGEEI